MNVQTNFFARWNLRQSLNMKISKTFKDKNLLNLSEYWLVKIWGKQTIGPVKSHILAHTDLNVISNI